MDTDSIVSALVSGYKVKKDSYVKAQTKLEWKQTAWKELNNKISSFYSSTVANMRFSSAYNLKKSVSSSTKANVSASNGAVNGTQKLKINKLASSGYLTGGIVSKADSADTSKVTGSSKLSELGIESGSKITVGTGSGSKTITVTSSMTVNQFVASMKDAGVEANFDEHNQRFFVSAKESGASADFSITASNESGSKALSALGLALTTEADMDKYRTMAAWTEEDIQRNINTDYTKLQTALYDINDEATVKQLKDALQAEIDNAKKQLESGNQANEEIARRKAAVDTYDSEYGILTEQEQKTYMKDLDKQIEDLSKKSDKTDEEKEKLLELQSKKTVYQDLSKENADKDEYLTKLDEQKAKNDEKIEELGNIITKNETILGSDAEFEEYVNGLKDDITKANEALLEDITKSYHDKAAQAKEYVNAYNLVNAEGADKTSEEYQKASALLGMNQGKTGATRIVGSDAEIELNGATFTSTSNSFSINGLNITANELTEAGEEISITTNTDTQGIYDNIKGFINKYNELLKEMNTLYNAESAKGYEPLTDEEKEALTESEVDKWEKKVKDALLRKDSTLGDLTNAFKNQMMKSYTVDGETLSLASFGIKTQGYFTSEASEKGLYHIDGNSEDSISAGNTDKLMAAISADPDKVINFFTQLTQGLYTEMTNRMKTSSLKSYGSFYNDKTMKKEYDSYKDTIKTWEQKIEDYEAKYRKQFAAMEKALSTLNSQQSSLSGLLGM